MRNVEIYINGNRVDYAEAKSIPLSLRKRTDKFLEIVGADGSEVDNALRSLTLPPTTTNQKYLLSLIAHSALGRGSTRVAVQCIVNGIQLFAGPGILQSAKKVSNSTPYYTLQLLGDGLSLWETIETLSLPDLTALGGLDWTFANILTNWNDATVQLFKGYFCPVVYGTERHDGIFSVEDFRPSVRFAPILHAIFNHAGYTLHSEFFETQFFQRHAHTFGVGAKWRVVADEWEKASYVGAFGAHVAGKAPPTLPETRMVPHEPIQDPSGMDHINGEPPLLAPTIGVNPDYENYLEVPYEGIYDLQIQINSQQAGTIDVLLVRAPDVWPAVTDTLNVLGFDATADAALPGDIVKTRETLQAGDQIWLQYFDGDPIWAVNVRRIRVKLTFDPTPYVGAEIALNSCLPDRPVKEFLRGVSHMFDLAWRVDDVTKRVFSEPRFDYTLIEAGEPVTRKGFYRRDYPLETVQIDAEEVSVEYATPFGSSLKLAYKSGSDPMEKALLAEIGRDEEKGIAPYGAEITLHDRGKAGELSANPYFTGLYQSKPDAIQLREEAFLPTVLPSGFNRGDKLPGLTWTPPGGDETTESAPTYESEPKCGIIFPKALSFEWYYDDSDTTYFSEDVRAPWITQQKWNDVGGLEALANYDSVPAYADLFSKDTGRLIRGLVSTFYPHYISVVKEGQVLSGRIIISLPKFTAIDFRRMWGLKYDSNDSIWILLELTNFRALVASDCQGKFIKYVSPKKADLDAIVHDDPPADPIIPDVRKLTI